MTDPVNNQSAADDEAKTVFRLGVKIPPFWPEDAALWFAQIEDACNLLEYLNSEGLESCHIHPRYRPIMKDPNIRTFCSLYKRFFTVWTMFLQIVFASLALMCDYQTLKYDEKRQPWWLDLMKNAKDRMFAAVLWPTAFLVFTMFWSLYHYDRSLIYPLFADELLSNTSNHVMHTAIVPLVIWEVLFQRRTVPKSHAVNFSILSVYMFTYLSIMYHTYSAWGIWLYPIFGVAHDRTLCFPLSIAIIGVALYIYYRAQWVLTRIIWGSNSKVKI